MFLFKLLCSDLIIYILSFLKPKELINFHRIYSTKEDDNISSVLQDKDFWALRCRQDLLLVHQDPLLKFHKINALLYTSAYGIWENGLLSKLHNAKLDDLPELLEDFYKIPFDDPFFQNINVTNYVTRFMNEAELTAENITLISDLLKFKLRITTEDINFNHVGQSYFPRLLTRLQQSGVNMLRLKMTILSNISKCKYFETVYHKFIIIGKLLLPDLPNVGDHRIISEYSGVLYRVMRSNNAGWLNLIVESLNNMILPVKIQFITQAISMVIFNNDEKSKKDVINSLLLHQDLKRFNIDDLHLIELFKNETYDEYKELVLSIVEGYKEIHS